VLPAHDVIASLKADNTMRFDGAHAFVLCIGTQGVLHMIIIFLMQYHVSCDACCRQQGKAGRAAIAADVWQQTDLMHLPFFGTAGCCKQKPHKHSHSLKATQCYQQAHHAKQVYRDMLMLLPEVTLGVGMHGRAVTYMHQPSVAETIDGRQLGGALVLLALHWSTVVAGFSCCCCCCCCCSSSSSSSSSSSNTLCVCGGGDGGGCCCWCHCLWDWQPVMSVWVWAGGTLPKM